MYTVAHTAVAATFTLATGSDANLSISADGKISAAAPIATGTTQSAIVRETVNGVVSEFPVMLTGVAP